MMSFSDMDMTYYNMNILFVHPLLFIPSFTMLFRKKQDLKGSLLLGPGDGNSLSGKTHPSHAFRTG